MADKAEEPAAGRLSDEELPEVSAAKPSDITIQPEQAAVIQAVPVQPEQSQRPQAEPEPAEQPQELQAEPEPAEQPQEPQAEPIQTEQPQEPQAEPEPAEQPQEPQAEPIQAVQTSEGEPAQTASGRSFCPSCGAAVEDEDCAFCVNCGASLKEYVTPSGESSIQKPSGGEKKKNARRAWVPILAAVLILLVIAGAFLLLVKGKGKGGAKAALYIKKEELYYNSLKKNAESLEVTDELAENGNALSTSVQYSVYLTEDGKKLIYPDHYSQEDRTYALYFRDPTRPDDDPVRIDKGVYSYSVGNGEDCLIYTKKTADDNEIDVYYYDFRDKTKLGSYCGLCQISEDAKSVVYTDENKKLYYCTIGRDKEKIDSDVMDICFVSKDFKTVYYMKDDDGTLYRRTLGRDRERLIKDVASVISVAQDGCVYYLGNSELKYSDFITDKKREADAAMKIPEMPEAPHWYADNYDELFEQYEKDYEIYEEQAQEYYEKECRDYIRETLDRLDENEDTVSDLQPLYCYDGKESTLLAEAVTRGGLYYNHRGEKGAIVYTAYTLPESAADISEMDFFSPDRVLMKLLEHGEYYCAAGKNSVEIDADVIRGCQLTDGKVFYIDTAAGEDSKGDLCCINIENGSPDKPECIDDDVEIDGLLCGKENCFYFKDMKTNRSGALEGDLYKNGEMVDSDVKVYSFKYDKDRDILYYMADFNQEKFKGELRSWRQGKTETLADEAYTYEMTGDRSGLLYLGNYSAKRARGTLYLYDGGKIREIDDGVTTIIVPVRKKEE